MYSPLNHILLSYSTFYSIITILQAGVRLLVFLFVAKFLGPEKYALWPLVQAIMSYSMLIGFGVMPALGRELAIYKGGGRIRRYNLVLGNSFVFLAGFWLCIVALAIVIIINNFEHRFYAYGLLLALLQSFIQFFLKIHRANLDFKRLFWAILAPVIFLPVGSLVLVKLPSLDLFCIIFALSLIVQLFWLFDYKTLKDANLTGSRFFLKTIFYLQKIGIPLLASGSIVTLLFSIDRWFVNFYFSRALLGQYAFAVFGAMGVQLLITSIAQVSYPTIAYGYGASKKLSSQARDMFLFLVFTLSLLFSLVLVVWFVLPSVMVRWFPSYLEGLTAAKWLVIGGLALPFAFLSSIVLQVKKILWPLVAGQSAGLFLGALAIYYGSQGGSLESVGMSVALSYVLYSFCVVGVTVILFRHRVRSVCPF